MLGQAAHQAVSSCLVADVDRSVHPAFGLAYRAGDATQGVEIVVHGGDAQFHRVEVLVGELHVGQGAFEQALVLHRFAADTVGKALALAIGFGEFVLVFPTAVFHQVVHIRAIGAIGIAKHPQGCGFKVATVFGLVGQGVFAHKVVFWRLVGLRCQQGSFGDEFDLQGHQVAEYARQGNHHINAGATQLCQRH